MFALTGRPLLLIFLVFPCVFVKIFAFVVLIIGMAENTTSKRTSLSVKNRASVTSAVDLLASSNSLPLGYSSPEGSRPDLGEGPEELLMEFPETAQGELTDLLRYKSRHSAWLLLSPGYISLPQRCYEPSRSRHIGLAAC